MLIILATLLTRHREEISVGKNCETPSEKQLNQESGGMAQVAEGLRSNTSITEPHPPKKNKPSWGAKGGTMVPNMVEESRTSFQKGKSPPEAYALSRQSL
jgi:hypothetical protein